MRGVPNIATLCIISHENLRELDEVRQWGNGEKGGQLWVTVIARYPDMDVYGVAFE